MTLAAEILVLELLELDYQVSSDVSSCLMTLLLEDQFGALRETWFDFNLLHSARGLNGLGIVLHNILVVVDLLDAAIVELIKGTVQGDHDVFWRTSLGLLDTSKTVSKDAWVDIFAAQVTPLRYKVSLGEHDLEVGLRLGSQKVTAPDFLCNNRFQTR